MRSKHYNRRDFLKAVSFSAASALLTNPMRGLAAGTGSNKPLNIIYIMSDDHASHAISAYGSKINKTPNIDRIANEGMRFDNCFCTNSICAPSRAVVLTGKYSHINGQINNGKTFNPKHQMYSEVLKKAGYETAAIGKWHLQTNPKGFDHWEILPGQGHYYNPDFIQMDGSKKRYKGYCSDLITDMSIDWLEKKRDKNKPFLLVCQHKAPHRPWLPPIHYLDKYKEGTIPEPDTLFADHATRCPASKESEMSIEGYMHWQHDMKFKGENKFPKYFKSRFKLNEYKRMSPEEQEKWDAYYEPKNEEFIKQMQEGKLSDKDIVRWKYQRYMHDYLGSVAALDDAIGKLLDYLDEKGLTENTLIVYTSDQGFYLGDHGWFDKRFMYEESLRMPLLIRWPNKVKAGSVNDDIVMNLDFAETFLDAAGVKIPTDMQGESLKPILLGHTPENWRDSMYYHYYEFPSIHMVKKHYGIRTKRYKLIHFYNDIDCWELYDLQEDPKELKNLYNDPNKAELIKKLKKQLKALQEKYKVDKF